MKIFASDLFIVVLRGSGKRDRSLSIAKIFFTMHQKRFRGKFSVSNDQVANAMIVKKSFFDKLSIPFWEKFYRYLTASLV
jgi:hypothetical protein